MDILNHEPVALCCAVLEGVESDLLLTLSHRNVSEGLVHRGLSVFGTDALDIRCRVHTREEHEEGGLDYCHLIVDNLHVEGWLLDEIVAETVNDILGESTLETIGSECSQK